MLPISKTSYRFKLLIEPGDLRGDCSIYIQNGKFIVEHAHGIGTFDTMEGAIDAWNKVKDWIDSASRLFQNVSSKENK